jgi:hypothetical protein
MLLTALVIAAPYASHGQGSEFWLTYSERALHVEDCAGRVPGRRKDHFIEPVRVNLAAARALSNTSDVSGVSGTAG